MEHRLNNVCMHVCVYRTASLLRPARCYARPLFSGEITVKGYFTSITRPPPRAGLPYCSSARVRVLQV